MSSRGSWLHRLPPRPKVLALVAFALLVVATPAKTVWLFAAYALLLLGLLIRAHVRPGFVLRRMAVELPFVVFALLMPVVATGPRVPVGPFMLSEAGLWGAWGLLAKATLATLAAVLLVATTAPRRIALALRELGLPGQLGSIVAFMVRYLDLISDERRRMATARRARGFTARGPRDWRILAQGSSALFVRSHARAERVHLAMLARGLPEDVA